MRLALPRFTVRRLMIAVAIVGVTLGMSAWMVRRVAGLRYEESRHFSACIDCLSQSFVERADYHRRMSYKFRWAASYPWFPVESDPVGGCCCEHGYVGAATLRANPDRSCCDRHVKPRRGVAACCPAE
jgi:hypothetical protein